MVIVDEPDLTLHDLYHLARDPRDNSVLSQGLWHEQALQNLTPTPS